MHSHCDVEITSGNTSILSEEGSTESFNSPGFKGNCKKGMFQKCTENITPLV